MAEPEMTGRPAPVHELTVPDALGRATKLLSRLSEQGIRIWVEGSRLRCSAPPGSLDDDLRQTLHRERDALMTVLGAPAAAPPARARLSSGQPPALTLAQESLLPLARSREADGTYNVPLALNVAGTIHPEALYVAVNAVMAKHDSLRTCFPRNVAGPSLRPRSAAISAEDVQTDAQDLDTIAVVAHSAIARPFDLEHGPLWRYCSYNCVSGSTVLLFVFHHLVFDGFSRDVFVRELAEHYAAARNGARLPDAPAFQPGDFAAWERSRCVGQRAEAARQWMGSRFAFPCPSTVLPAADKAAAASSRSIRFPSGLREALYNRAALSRLPPAALAMAAGLLALHRVTGQERILAMVPFSNRDIPESVGIIGYINRVLPVAIGLEPSGPLGGLISAVARELSESATHGFLPAPEITGQPCLARTQINRLMISWQERRRSNRDFAGLGSRELSFGRTDSDFGLALQFEADGGQFHCRIDSAPGVLGPDGQTVFSELLVEALKTVVGPDWEAGISHVAPRLLAADRLSELLRENSCVKDAAAISNPQDGLMTAWIVLDEENRTSDTDLLTWIRARLGGILPPVQLRTSAHLSRAADGRVNLEALLRTLPSDTQHPEAPQTDMERLIAETWRKALWLDRPVGRNEDFKLLGGHSLLAVRMMSDLEAALGRTIDPSSIARLSTVAELAAAIESPRDARSDVPGMLDPQIHSRLRVYTASWQGVRPFEGALIVGRNTRGSRAPLFWCLQNETELDQLARYIGDDQPVFGMRSGHAVMVKSRENIDQLARHYAHEIMKVSPAGPLLLGGNCQAAVIAFHAARHLGDAGRDVALLFLHEKMIPENYAGRIALSFGRDSNRNPYRVSRDPHADFRPYYSGTFSVDLVPGAHGEFFREPIVAEFVAILKRRRDEAPLLNEAEQQP